MYNLLIVEDESFVREMLCDELSDKLSEYFNIVCADDGKTALEIMENTEVHVVLTDILMPFVSGLELAEEISKKYKNCFVMIMSGYEEFEYAKKALTFGVKEYFVKPFETSIVCEKILALKKVLDDTNKTTKVDENLLEVQTDFFTDLIYGGITDLDSDMLNSLKLPFNLKETPCNIISIKVENFKLFLDTKWNYGKEEFITAINNVVVIFFGNQYAFPIHNKNGVFDYIIYHKETVVDFHSIVNKIRMILNIPINLYYESDVYMNLEDIVQNHKKITDIEEIVGLFVSSVKENDTKKSIDILKKILDSENSRIKLENFLQKLEIENPNDFISNLDKPEELYQRIIKTGIFDVDIVSESIRRAKKYIQENYYKDISREDVAKIAFFSPNYFTRNFKKYTGENFNEYLFKIRMEKAIELMKLNKYTAETISHKVGYSDARYFYKLFKLYTGYTTKEYMKHIKEKQV